MSIQIPNDNNEAAAQEIVDYFYQNFQPFTTKPSKHIEMLVDNFVEQMGFHPGTLHMCYYEFPWLQGDLENPEWLGSSEGFDQKDLSFLTDPEEVFLVVGHVLLKAIFDKVSGKKDEYTFALKVMVGDKIGYCPIPADVMTVESIRNFKTLFSQVCTT